MSYQFIQAPKPELPGIRKDSTILFLEEIVTDLELSIELEKKGYNEPTCFMWVTQIDRPDSKPFVIVAEGMDVILDYNLVAAAYLIDKKISLFVSE